MAINLYSKASVDDLLAAKLSDAPIDGDTYGRKDGAWEIIAGGGGVSWGGITGTLADQTDLNTALGLLAPSASPTFTGTVTIPAGASISGYLTTATASSTYLAKTSNLSDLANAGTARTNLGLGGLAVLNDAPSNGSQYARQNGAWAVVTGGGGGGVDVQTFGTSSTSGTFTWTKPAGAKVVDIYLMGPGGGGGSGARQATSSARSGGGGGASGGLFYFRVGADSLNSTESVVIGAGGAGGAARTTDNSAGLNGSSGVNTTFSVYKAPSGDFGLAGSTATVSGGAARNNLLFDLLQSTGAGGAGNAAQGSSSNLSTALFMHAGGGGGGGGAAAASTTNVNGGTGGSAGASSTNPGLITAIAAGAAGNGTTGVQATAGTSITTQYIRGGTGGGGGFYRTGQAGGTAGAGGWPGGGGGGGGASDNGFASGAGAAGANGYAVIITYS